MGVTTQPLALDAPHNLVEADPVQLTVVVPAYNEEQAIVEQLCRIRQVLSETSLSWEVLVIDDGSEDRTAERANEVDGVRMISHGRNRGCGAATKTGIRRAAGEIVCLIDADGQHPPDEIPRLVEELGDADMAVGARTGEDVHAPLLRRPVKWFLNKLASYLAGTRIPDINTGFRAFRKREVLPFLSFLPNGFSFHTTITLAMLCNDMLVRFIPINSSARQGGRSKIRPIRDTCNFVVLVLRTICCFNPLKVFGPVAFVLLLGGLTKLGVEVIVDHNIADTSVLLLLSGLQVAAMGLLAEVMARLPSLPRGSQSDTHEPGS